MPLTLSNNRAEVLPACLLVHFSEISFRLAEFRRNTGNAVVGEIGLRRALEKSIERFLCDWHTQLCWRSEARGNETASPVPRPALPLLSAPSRARPRAPTPKQESGCSKIPSMRNTPRFR